MMRVRPDVSVVMPVYNAEAYLKDVLEALAAQTCKSMEVIAVDDGSTDRSGEMLDEFASAHAWLRVIHQTNCGAYRARQAGIDAANGMYIACCDSDDIPLPDMYQRLLEVAESEKADLTVCTYVREEMETERALSHEMKALAGMTMDMDQDPSAFAAVNTALWNKLYRAEILKQVMRFENPPRIMEDMMMSASVIPLMHKIVIIPDMLYRYRIRRNSAILTLRQEDLPNMEKCMLSVRQRVQEHSNDEKMLRLIDSMAFIHFGTSAVLRRIQGGDSIGQAVADARAYLDSGYPTYRKPTYGLAWNVRNRLVMIKPLIALRCFQWRLMVPLFVCYRFVTEKLHIEIKW